MKVYSYHNGLRIIIYIVGAIFIVAGFGSLLLPLYDTTTPLKAMYFLVPVGIFELLLGVGSLVEAIRGKIIFDNDQITTEGVFPRSLHYNEIKGFRINDNYVVLVPDSPTQKSLKISKYIQGYGDMKRWAANNFKNLDLRENLDVDLEVAGAVHESTVDEQVKAKRSVTLLNICTASIIVAGLFFRNDVFYRTLCIHLLLICPLIATWLLYHYRGIVILNAPKERLNSSADLALFFPSVCLFLVVLSIFNLQDIHALWLPLGIGTALMSYLLIMSRAQQYAITKKGKTGTVIWMIVLAALYSCSAVVMININLDKSTPVDYTVKVINKRISRGKMDNYYLELAPWGPQTTAKEMNVGKMDFQVIDVNDEITISYKKGLLGIPWYFLKRE